MSNTHNRRVRSAEITGVGGEFNLDGKQLTMRARAKRTLAWSPTPEYAETLLRKYYTFRNAAYSGAGIGSQQHCLQRSSALHLDVDYVTTFEPGEGDILQKCLLGHDDWSSHGNNISKETATDQSYFEKTDVGAVHVTVWI